jgi:hypothetical protein
MIRKLAALFSAALLGTGLALAAPAGAAQAATCTVTLGQNCGPYQDNVFSPMSNGFNTYVANQDVGAFPQTTATLTAGGPQSWSLVADAQPYGNGSVELFPDTQQLTNDWDGAGWDGTADTPVDQLSTLAVNYTEAGPSGANDMYEFAPDVWTNYPSDVMFWADTVGRCNPGSYGDTILGTAVFGGQTWTVNRYGGPGAEIIMVLDTDPGTPNSCAHQQSGTIDIKAGLDWLSSNGFIPGPVTMTQLNTGYEITSAEHATFTVSAYTITATPGSGGGGTPQAPVVNTQAATGVTASAATLNGTVNPEAQATTYQFDYGTTTSYGTSVPVPAGDAGSGSASVAQSATLAGLAPSTAYHYRVEATNATGTTLGADQVLTTAAAGNSVAFGSATAARSFGSRSLSFTQTVGSGTDRALLVEASVGISNDVGCTQKVTDNGVAMTRLTVVHSNGGDEGYMDLWARPAPPAGANVISVKMTGCTPSVLTAGGESFSHVDPASPFSAVTAATGFSITPSVTVPATAAGNLVAGFITDGNPLDAALSPAVSRFIENGNSSSGAGNSGGVTAPATGSGVTLGWTQSASDWWGIAGVQLNHD